MNPGALPPALSELFLPEPATSGERAERPGTPSSNDPSAQAERFEHYLSSARRSAVGRPTPPRAATSDGTATARADQRGSTVDRSARSERPGSPREDRRPVDDRSPESGERPSPAATGERVGADDRAVDRTDEAERSEDPAATSGSDRAARDSDAEADLSEPAPGIEAPATGDRSTDAVVDAETTTGPTRSVLPTESVDLAEVVDDPAPTEVIEGGDGTPPSVETTSAPPGVDVGEGDGSGDASEQTAATESDETGDDPSLDGRAARAVDQTTAAAVAVAGSTTSERQVEPTASPEETFVDLDQPVLDELGQDSDGATGADDGTPATATGTETETDLTEGEPGADDGGSTADDGGSTADTADTADTAADGDRPSTGEDAPSGNDTASTDGPDTITVPGPPTSVAGGNGSTAAVTNPVAGVDAASGTTGPRNGTTTTISTQGAQQTQAPPADGEAGDPLWLQVRRAMGSLRTLQTGEQQMTIRLRPAELGSVMVRVSAGDQGTTVSLVADSAVAASQLTQQRQQLIGELERSGLAGVAVDVGTGGDTDLRDGADGEDREASGGPDTDGTRAAAAVVGGLAAARTGGRGRRSGGSSGGLLDVEL